ncbi:hypothetical protein ACWKW6_00780 [Dyadobacter jiangsuensis]|uniref:hypothetical protein n=1 Tax=Dyadobacter fermentans TaxID=94254 RepID=UPI001CBDB9EF|nr:hypothetical protein [Dyadobacter fermentans]
MGRFLSLLLFALLLYNMMGYSVLYLCEDQYVPTAAGREHIERTAYSRDIVVKVPVSLPYQTDWSVPEPSEGKIRHEGEYYQIRTKQLLNDTLYVYCEYDQNARDRYMELVDHIQNETISAAPGNTVPKSHAKLLKSFLKEFMTSPKKHVFFVMEWIETTPSATDQYSCPVFETCHAVLTPPPDRLLT